MNGRRFCLSWLLSCCVAISFTGCGTGGKSTASAGSPAPSLDSPDAAERAAAAREAAKKYGAGQ
jgi:hypothetical protein